MLPRVSWRIDTSHTGPSARWAHTLSSCNGTAAILVAGFANATYLGDAWIARARGTGLVEWLQPFPTYGCALPARSNHAAIDLGEGRVVVSGGGGPQGLKHGDTILLTLDADDGLLCQRVIHAAPPGGGAQVVGCERSFHGGARIRESIFCLFGGSSRTRADTNDVRLCSLVTRPIALGPDAIGSGPTSHSGGASSDVICHTESFSPSLSGGAWPSERRLHAMARHELSSAVILHGGCAGPQFSPLGDAWVLQPASDRDRGGPGVITSALHAGLCLKWEKPPCVSGRPPPARCGHSLTAIPGRHSFVMFGGSVDGRESSALPGEDVVHLADTADLFILTVVLAAPLDAEGMRGSSLPRVSGFEWTRVAAPFTVPRPLEQLNDWPEARRRHGAAVLSGIFCVFGGYDGAVYLGRAHCVPISELLGCADAARAQSAAAAALPLPLAGSGAGLASDTWGDFDPFGSASAAAPVPVAPAALAAPPPQSEPITSTPLASCATHRPFDPFSELPANTGPPNLSPMRASSDVGPVGVKNSNRKAIPRAWIETCAAAVAGLGFKASTVAAAVAALEASPEGIAPYASPDALAEYVCAHADDLVKTGRAGLGGAALALDATRGSVVQSSKALSHLRGSQADVQALLSDEVRGLAA